MSTALVRACKDMTGVDVDDDDGSHASDIGHIAINMVVSLSAFAVKRGHCRRIYPPAMKQDAPSACSFVQASVAATLSAKGPTRSRYQVPLAPRSTL